MRVVSWVVKEVTGEMSERQRATLQKSVFSSFGRDLGRDWVVVVGKYYLDRRSMSDRKKGAREGR